MKQKLAYYEVQSAPKNGFSLNLITFYGNVSQFVVFLLSIMVVSPQLKNWFFEAKRLCQRIKHRFVVCILFWRIQIQI